MKKKKQKIYTPESLQEEREYGIYWYSWLWSMVRPVLVFLCSALLLIGVVSTIVNKGREEWINPVNALDQSEIVFVVNSGDSLSRVSKNLEKQNIVRSSSFFKYYADFSGFSQKIQAGEYKLNRAMSVKEILENLASGDGRPMVRSITVIPGWTVEDIAAYLVKEKILATPDAFLSKCRSGSEFNMFYYVSDVLSSGRPADRKYALEGYLAPDTYEIYVSADESEIIKKLLSQTEAVYKEPFHARAEELGMSMDEVITLASLIEKEAKTADFAKVSAVFHNRLKDNMTLGSDVTIKYVLGTKRMVLNQNDLNVQSYFNTYRNKGLPIGPICSPSPGAIQAALYPDESFIQEKVLYFCSKDPDTGELHFSKTLAEHEQAVQIYAPLWEAFDKKTGAQ